MLSDTPFLPRCLVLAQYAIATDDPKGTSVWKHRAGSDFAVGRFARAGDGFQSLMLACFDESWQWNPDLATRAGESESGLSQTRQRMGPHSICWLCGP
ncbi:hypothetical protein J3R74_002020 [Puniceicoccus vermicola]